GSEDHKRAYIVLCALLLFVSVIQARTWSDLVQDLKNRYIGLPIALGPRSTIMGMRAEARLAGVRVNDVLASVDGYALAARKDLARMVRSHRPGDSVRLEVRRGGALLDFDVQLAPIRSQTVLVAWAFAILIWFLMPALALSLGFWVAAARPADIRAWIL